MSGMRREQSNSHSARCTRMSKASIESGRCVNVLILAGGQAGPNADDDGYPLCLAEINGAPLIQHLISLCEAIGTIRIVVAFAKTDIDKFHIDSAIEVLAPGAAIVSVEKYARGAACTALLAAGYIDSDDELLVVNGNELIDVDFRAVLDDFRGRQLDAGTVTFSSIHPRYSYVRLTDDGFVVEAAEKRPISAHATAGFYWFARGSSFVQAAEEMIYKDASVNGKFYICPVLNELVLQQALVGVYPIKPGQYRPLKTVRQIMQQESAERRGYQ